MSRGSEQCTRLTCFSLEWPFIGSSECHLSPTCFRASISLSLFLSLQSLLCLSPPLITSLLLCFSMKRGKSRAERVLWVAVHAFRTVLMFLSVMNSRSLSPQLLWMCFISISLTSVKVIAPNCSERPTAISLFLSEVVHSNGPPREADDDLAPEEGQTNNFSSMGGNVMILSTLPAKVTGICDSKTQLGNTEKEEERLVYRPSA